MPAEYKQVADDIKNINAGKNGTKGENPEWSRDTQNGLAAEIRARASVDLKDLENTIGVRKINRGDTAGAVALGLLRGAKLDYGMEVDYRSDKKNTERNKKNLKDKEPIKLLDNPMVYEGQFAWVEQRGDKKVLVIADQMPDKAPAVSVPANPPAAEAPAVSVPANPPAAEAPAVSVPANPPAAEAPTVSVPANPPAAEAPAVSVPANPPAAEAPAVSVPANPPAAEAPATEQPAPPAETLEKITARNQAILDAIKDIKNTDNSSIFSGEPAIDAETGLLSFELATDNEVDAITELLNALPADNTEVAALKGLAGGISWFSYEGGKITVLNMKDDWAGVIPDTLPNLKVLETRSATNIPAHPKLEALYTDLTTELSRYPKLIEPREGYVQNTMEGLGLDADNPEHRARLLLFEGGLRFKDGEGTDAKKQELQELLGKFTGKENLFENGQLPRLENGEIRFASKPGTNNAEMQELLTLLPAGPADGDLQKLRNQSDEIISFKYENGSVVELRLRPGTLSAPELPHLRSLDAPDATQIPALPELTELTAPKATLRLEKYPKLETYFGTDGIEQNITEWMKNQDPKITDRNEVMLDKGTLRQMEDHDRTEAEKIYRKLAAIDQSAFGVKPTRNGENISLQTKNGATADQASAILEALPQNPDIQALKHLPRSAIHAFKIEESKVTELALNNEPAVVDLPASLKDVRVLVAPKIEQLPAMPNLERLWAPAAELDLANYPKLEHYDQKDSRAETQSISAWMKKEGLNPNSSEDRATVVLDEGEIRTQNFFERIYSRWKGKPEQAEQAFDAQEAQAHIEAAIKASDTFSSIANTEFAHLQPGAITITESGGGAIIKITVSVGGQPRGLLLRDSPFTRAQLEQNKQVIIDALQSAR